MLAAATKRTVTLACTPQARAGPSSLRAIATTSISSPTPTTPPPPSTFRNSDTKRKGDISDSFASLSGLEYKPLPDKYRLIKKSIIAGHEPAIIASWTRLLTTLKIENAIISQLGPSVIPQIPFSSLDSDLLTNAPTIRQRGVAIIRNVVPSEEARSWKFELEEYIKQNASKTHGFPADNPQVWELYWSSPQMRARLHPNLLKTQTALMTGLWHTESDPYAEISLSTPLTYADRLRIRQPGDAKFALGPHQDGGSVERWDPEGYGKGGVYDAVFRGEWEAYDPYDAAGRVKAENNLHNGLGACSMFRMFQGWMAMSEAGPGRGTLLVNPLVREATAYSLLRPFFRPVRRLEEVGGDRERFLEGENWVFEEDVNSDLQGATPGHGQEYPEGLHPHLELDKTMVSIPDVQPGDFVVWHCDTIHAVDKVHNGNSDSSVMYIPVCPATEASGEYVAKQRDAFLAGTPAPDFPGGKGEAEHIGRPTKGYVIDNLGPTAAQSMGLAKLEAPEEITPGAAEAIKKVNTALGF